MATQAEQLKDQIEGGESCVYAYEQVDLEQMTQEGDGDLAQKINMVLILVGEINEEVGIE